YICNIFNKKNSLLARRDEIYTVKNGTGHERVGEDSGGSRVWAHGTTTTRTWPPQANKLASRPRSKPASQQAS
ncbi:MAG TPA: hypothetical protein V6C97_05450, partial [Oculatellaceae cyanobacterium]